MTPYYSMATQAEDRPTFELEGITYNAEPTLVEFLAEAGFQTTSAQTRAKKALNDAGHEGYISLLALSVKEITDIENISPPNAKIIYNHAIRVKSKGNLVTNYNGMLKREENFNYLPTGSSSLDEMLTYSGGQVGWRSKTLIELYAKPAMGKTQICPMECSFLYAEK